MMLALALALIASPSVGSYANPPAVARFKDDPPIQVWLSSDNHFVRGQRAQVFISTAADGYVVVLRADAQGRVRVLFPLDPSNDEVVRGDRKFEVESGGGHEAFTVDDEDGTGVVLAAWSESPFTFDGLVDGDRWDYAALSALKGSSDSGSEAGLVEIVQSMAGENQFAYDVATYTVNSVTAYNDGSQADGQSNDSEQTDDQENENDGRRYDGPYYGGPYYGPWFGPVYGGVGLSIGYGWRHGYVGIGPFCDGFYWTSWGCGIYDPFYGPRVYRTYRPYVYRPYVYRTYGGGRLGGVYRGRVIGYGGGSRTYVSGYGRSWYGAQPRVRVSAGGSFSGSNRGYVRARTGTRSYAPGLKRLRSNLQKLRPQLEELRSQLEELQRRPVCAAELHAAR